MAAPLVSIVIPAFNSERFLGEAIESALAQTYEAIEVIVVDDGSTDGTAAVATGFGEKVTLLEQENAGPSAARNSGVAVSRGELVAFHDADDVMTEHRIETQVSHLLAHPGAGCVLGQQDVFLEAGAERPYWMPGTKVPVVGPPRPAADATTEIEPRRIPHTMSAVVRREVFDAVGGFDESMRHTEDVDLLLRVVDGGHGVSLLPDVLVHRRVHEASLTQDSLAGREGMFRAVKARMERKRALE